MVSPEDFVALLNAAKGTGDVAVKAVASGLLLRMLWTSGLLLAIAVTALVLLVAAGKAERLVEKR